MKSIQPVDVQRHPDLGIMLKEADYFFKPGLLTDCVFCSDKKDTHGAWLSDEAKFNEAFCPVPGQVRIFFYGICTECQHGANLAERLEMAVIYHSRKNFLVIAPELHQ